MSEEPIVMSPEQLWGASEEDIEKYRGETLEITEFEHKVAHDFKDFSESVNIDKNDRSHIIRDGTSIDDYSDDQEEFFDRVEVTQYQPENE